MRYCLLIILLFCSAALHAQVTFSFVPEVQGRTVDGLFLVRTVNAGTRKTAALQVTVTERAAGKVVSMQTRPFEVLPGANPLPPGVARQAAVIFGVGQAATVAKQSGYFTAGDFEYCFQLIEDKGTGPVMAEQCFQYLLQPFSPLVLTQPVDGDVICDKRPAFFWQPLLPAVPGVEYRLALVELRARQSKTEAVNVNQPLINQRNIPTTMLFYPAVNRELQEGKSYAWQVTAYKGATMLAQSEIWEFSCNCTNEEKDSTGEAFRDIEDLAKGNFYLAEGRVMFSLRNAYAESNLSYQVFCITRPDDKIKKLPKIKLRRGQNNILIDLREVSGLQDGHYYRLQVKLPGGMIRTLRFLYKTPLAT